MTTETEVVVLTTVGSKLWEHEGLLGVLALDRKDAERNQQYLDDDVWRDNPDKVKHAGIQGEFFTVRNYLVLDFDPEEYPEHTEIAARFLRRLLGDEEAAKDFDYERYHNTTEKYARAESAVAYRGGQGYVYGIYVFTGTLEDHTPGTPRTE